MPASIALFIKEALAEDKFGNDFNSRIDERVDAMNAAQLQGIYDHLLQTSRTASTSMWRNANKELIEHVEGLMRERVGEVQKARARVEEENAREDARDGVGREGRLEKVHGDDGKDEGTCCGSEETFQDPWERQISSSHEKS